METQIVVSIICNVYNHGKYIRDALEGFVSQKTNFSFEVLVHDDASTDNSAEIIREYAARYPDVIKPICQVENQHSRRVPITKTFQLPRAQGKYLAVCEGDDYWTDPMKLQKQFDFMEANPEYSMCACSAVWLDMRTGKQVHHLCTASVDRDVSLEEIILETKGRVFQFATLLMKKEIYTDKPAWTQKFRVGDTPLAMYAAMCGKVRMLSDTMVVYRNHAEGSWTSKIDKDVQFKKKMFVSMIEGLEAFDEATEHQYEETVSQRIKRYRYSIAKAERNLKALASGDLREVFESRSIMARLADILACIAPNLQSAIITTVRSIRKAK